VLDVQHRPGNVHDSNGAKGFIDNCVNAVRTKGFKGALEKTGSAGSVLQFHNGRGAQEGVFAELKSQLNLDYIPTRRLNGNQIYGLAVVLAHNLNRELQMATTPRTTPRVHARYTLRRACLWVFEKVQTVGQRLVQRAGRLVRPHAPPHAFLVAVLRE
jgi:hypothetical protein